MMSLKQMSKHIRQFTMAQFKPSIFIFIFAVTFFGFMVSIHYTGNRQNKEPIKPSVLQIRTQQILQQSRIPQSRVISSTSKAAPASPVPPVPQEPIPEQIVPEQPKNPDIKKEKPSEDCTCKSEKTGKSHSFCYQDPQNETSFGRKFDCGHLKILERLNLVDNPGPFVDLSKNEENSKQIVFVSAISDNHFNEATTSIAAFYRFYPNGHFILYSLGLHEIYTTNIKKDFHKLEVRTFNVTGYPDYVINWMEYRFKPLILAEVMKEFSNVWWMDAHIVVKKPMMVELLYNEIKENVKKADTEVPVPIYSFIHTSHSNYAVLFPEVLNYFPSNSMELLKSEKKGSQLGANTFFVARTEYSVEVFKWWILCALDKTCMAPPGAQVYCTFGDDRNKQFAKCFRFDQSILNLLMLNQYQDHHKYFSKQHEEFFIRI